MNKEFLLDILTRAQEFVSFENNKFLWTSWENSEEAKLELQQIQTELARDNFSEIQRLKIIFGPTGPLQELSIDSGWPERFIELAKDFDNAIQDIESN